MPGIATLIFYFCKKLFFLKKILIIQTASLGDVILSTPLIEKLIHFYPEAEIDFLLKKNYENLYKSHPHLNKVIIWDKSKEKYKHLKELVSLIRETKYDLVVNVQRFASSGLITTLSGAKMKIGFSKNPFSIFFTKRIKHKIGKEKGGPHETLRNLKLIESITDGSVFPVKLFPSKTDYAKVSQFKTKKYITVSPASLWFTKQFPEEKWAEFIKETEPELAIYFLGSEKEKQLCERIIGASGHSNSLNLAGKLSFLESAALMEHAAMNFVNDSAPMHLASSVNAPTTAIFLSTIPEFGFGPLSEDSTIIQTEKELKCKPCGLHGWQKCPEKHFDCAMTIKKEQLLTVL